MISVAIMGTCGRMGRSIIQTLQDDPEIEITGGTEIAGHELIGKDLGECLLGEKSNVAISDNVEDAAKNADIIIDFTTPESTIANSLYAARETKSMVIGTTGFTKEQKSLLEENLKTIPSVLSPNMSIGINVLFEASKNLAGLLGEEFDVEIVEAHHKNKKDSPSGTAIGLAQAVSEGLNVDYEKSVRYERYGNTGDRKKGEIGVQSIRGGDIVGDHTVMFLGEGERLELIHRALSRANFSRGVLRAVKWLPGKPPGIYSMKDVLGL